MAEIKKKTNWSETLKSMEIGESIPVPYNERDLCAARANYLKSKGCGEWSLSSNRDLKQSLIKRTK